MTGISRRLYAYLNSRNHVYQIREYSTNIIIRRTTTNNTSPTLLATSSLLNTRRFHSPSVGDHVQHCHCDTILPVAWTVAATFAAWAAVPIIYRRFHKHYTHELFQVGPFCAPVPYEKSVWGALQDPARYLILFSAFLQIELIVAPTTILTHFAGPEAVWKCAAYISLIWFLRRWKTNFCTRGWAMKLSNKDIDRHKLEKLSNLSSGFFIMYGGMHLNDSFGVPAIGYVLTAGAGVTILASLNILRDLVGGLYVHFGQIFSVGETIKVGYLEGEVIDAGLTTTSLLVDESIPPILVPNSLFMLQPILITSKPLLRDMVSKVTVQVDDIVKIQEMLEEIESMMNFNINVYHGEMKPYCNFSVVRRRRNFVKLTFGCTLKQMSEDGLVVAELDILRQSRELMKKHDAKVVKRVRL